MGLSFCTTNLFSVMVVFALLASIFNLSSTKAAADQLRVLVPRRVGFEQFVRWEKNDATPDGFSVEVFLQALQHLSRSRRPPSYKFIPYGDGKSTPAYDDMVNQVYEGAADAIVADITITRERIGKVDFTMPYMESALVMVTPFKYGSAGAIWGFLHPFSWQLWVALALSLIATGLVLYILENKNPDFSNHARSFKDDLAVYSEHRQIASSHSHSNHAHTIPQNTVRVPDSNEGMDQHGNGSIANGNSTSNAFDSNSSCQHPLPHAATLPSYLDETTARPLESPNSAISCKQQLLNAYWFTSLCIFFAQQESVRTHAGRVIVISWLFIVIIFTSSYTASLASLLSSQQAYPTIKDFETLLRNTDVKVGTLEGSFLPNYLHRHYFAKSRLKQYASEEDYAAGLKKDPNKGGVGAILDELPYIQIMLQSECGFNIVGGQIAYFGGFGFAFAKNSTWTDEVSKGILALAQEGVLQKLKDGWIGGTSRCINSDDASANHLRLRSFGGLFAILGGVYAACLSGRLSIKAFFTLGTNGRTF